MRLKLIYLLTQLTTRRVTHQLAQRFGMVLAFISVFASILWHFVYCQALRYSLGLGRASGQQSILPIYVCAFTCGHSFTVCSGWGIFSFWSFFVFLPPSSPFISLLCLLLCITIVVYCLLLLFSTELLALCDRCLGWGWVWVWVNLFLQESRKAAAW